MFRGTSFKILFGETRWFATKETILKGRIAMGMQMGSSTGMVIFAAAVISLALVFYTIGVFAERRSGTLKPKHLTLFWTGFHAEAIRAAMPIRCRIDSSASASQAESPR